MRRLFAPILCVLCLVAVSAWAGPPAEGTKAPPLSLKDFRDESQTVTSQVFRDHVTLISFFATWCESCKKEIRELKKLQDRYRSRGFQVVLVCLDIMGARNVGPYLEEAGGSDLRVLTDKGGGTSNRYGVMHLPTNVLVGADETIVLSWDNYHPERLMQVESYLSRLAPHSASPGDKP